LVSTAGADMGGKKRNIQSEIDSNGRTWIVTFMQVAEIVIKQGKATATFSHPEFTLSGGAIKS
jgi:hypothetical protein